MWALQPTNAADYHRTVAHLACSRAGATSPTSAANNTWSFFPGPGNVKTWDGRTLCYYESGVPWAGSVVDVAGLLEGGNGQCNSWRQLLQGAWALNGLQSTWMKAMPTATGANSFLVNLWTFGTPSLTNTTYNYCLQLNPDPDNGYTMVPTVSGDVVNQQGVAGQNSPTSAEKIFGKHSFPMLSLDNKYYDPSYGANYTDDASFQARAVAGYSIVTCPVNTNPFANVKPVGTKIEAHISPAP